MRRPACRVPWLPAAVVWFAAACGGPAPTAPSPVAVPAVALADGGLFSGLPLSGTRFGGTALSPALDTIPGPNLAAPEVTNSTVRLSWTAGIVGCCEIAASFIVQYGFEPGFDPSPSRNFNTNSAATSLTLPDVPPGIYYVRLIAWYPISGRLSAPSNEQTIRVGCTFTAPVLAHEVTGRDVFLAWTRATADDLYDIEVNGSVEVSGYRQATFTNPNTPDGVYNVRVRTVNSCGTSEWSNTVTVTVAASTGPIGIVRWQASFTITLMRNGYYRSTGTIDLTLNRAVTGAYRAEFNSYPFLGATKTFSGASQLHFDVTQDSFGCPDFHNTIPLYLYDSSGSIVASVNTTHRGTGCAFN